MAMKAGVPTASQIEAERLASDHKRRRTDVRLLAKLAQGLSNSHVKEERELAQTLWRAASCMHLSRLDT